MWLSASHALGSTPLGAGVAAGGGGVLERAGCSVALAALVVVGGLAHPVNARAGSRITVNSKWIFMWFVPLIGRHGWALQIGIRAVIRE
ncbi:MAG: hypothetical protein RKR03_20345 [Candidatus Competibacter sp.]|nr:hypothetical protein [Candidatus Competibacter sp.]